MFTFKQFIIEDAHCAMKVGTDGVLLGAWADVAGCRHITDIGCGSGLIALMAAQRAPEARVTGVEIDPEAVADAQANVAASPFAHRTEIVLADVCRYAAPAPKSDCLLRNPPYHEEDLLPPVTSRATACYPPPSNFLITPTPMRASRSSCPRRPCHASSPWRRYTAFMKPAAPMS